MFAAWYEKKGSPAQVLTLGEMASPEPGPNEVRVRIYASGLNPTDVKARSGWGPNTTMPFPRVIPHQDGAGMIESVGAGVSTSRIGQRVWVFEAAYKRAYGTAAEYTVVPAINAIPLPDRCTFAEGAAIAIPGMTAHRCLFCDGPINGQLILVTGGGGAVGNATIQLAKAAGAIVITTISRPEHIDIATRAGADYLVNYRTEDVKSRIEEITRLTGQTGVDRVVDVAFDQNIATTLAVLKPNGVIASYAAGETHTEARFPYYAAMFKGITMHFVLVYVMSAEAHALAARHINATLEAGTYRPYIGHRFRLEEIVAAHEALESGTLRGKAIIEMV